MEPPAARIRVRIRILGWRPMFFRRVFSLLGFVARVCSVTCGRIDYSDLWS